MAMDQIGLHVIVRLRLCVIIYCQRAGRVGPIYFGIHPERFSILVVCVLYADGQRLRCQLQTRVTSRRFEQHRVGVDGRCCDADLSRFWCVADDDATVQDLGLSIAQTLAKTRISKELA